MPKHGSHLQAILNEMRQLGFTDAELAQMGRALAGDHPSSTWTRGQWSIQTFFWTLKSIDCTMDPSAVPSIRSALAEPSDPLDAMLPHIVAGIRTAGWLDPDIADPIRVILGFLT